MNNVILAGRLTADPELKTLPTGTEMCNYTLACDRPFKDAQGQKQADFIYCKAWGKTAVFLQAYFHKGDGVVMKGHIETRRYEDKNGDTRTAFEVVAETVEFPLGKKSGASENGGTVTPSTFGSTLPSAPPSAFAAAQPDFDEIVDDDDELPF